MRVVVGVVGGWLEVEVGLARGGSVGEKQPG